MVGRRLRLRVSAAFLLLASAARAKDLPDPMGLQLPAGPVVLEAARGRLSGGKRNDCVVVLARPGDDPNGLVDGRTAPERPLLLFRAHPDGTCCPDWTQRRRGDAP